MKKLRLFFVLMLTVILLCAIATVTASADELVTGTWGTLEWEFNETTGHLTISGDGEMEDGYQGVIKAWREYGDLIQTVTIEEGVTGIGSSAFYKMENLLWVEIPSSVEFINQSAFGNCTRLARVTFSANCQLKTIGYSAFYQCESLEDIVFPSTLTSVGHNAFFGCRALTEIEIPSSLTDFGLSAFQGCINLERVTFGADSQLKALQGSLFYNCKALTSITLPSNLETIGGYAFYGCSSLKKLEFPLSLVTIGNYAFANCSALEEVQYPRCVGLFEDNVAVGAQNSDMWNHLKCADHQWGPGSVQKPATHTEYGTLVYTCVLCRNTRTEQIDKTPTHIYTWVCAGTLFHQEKCSCGLTRASDTHTWSNGKITKSPTHTEYGVKTYSCTACRATKAVQIAKTTEHEFGDWEKHDEVKHKRVCSCGETEYVEHAFGDWEDHSQSRHKRVCACGQVEYADHVFTEWVHSDETTHRRECPCGRVETKNRIIGKWEKADGEQHKRVCDCGEVQYEDHNWRRNEEEGGGPSYVCSVCGATPTLSSGCMTVSGGGALSISLVGLSAGWVAIKKKKSVIED